MASVYVILSTVVNHIFKEYQNETEADKGPDAGNGADVANGGEAAKGTEAGTPTTEKKEQPLRYVNSFRL